MTWSIIFHERDSGRIAIAVATKFFAVGARVPNIEPQKGAVCAKRDDIHSRIGRSCRIERFRRLVLKEPR